MKKFLLPLFASLLMFSIACNTGTSGAEGTDTPEVPETPTETPDDQAALGAAYEITVIDPAPKSPRKEMKASVGEAALTVNYGSPSVKGRTIWGGLEKYDEVWRAGANEATTFETSADIMVEGQPLAAGKYSLFIIPTKEGNWTAIFNGVAEQWGAYEYDAAKDVLRVEVAPVFVEDTKESLDYMMADGKLTMRWAKVAVGIDIK